MTYSWPDGAVNLKSSLCNRVLQLSSRKISGHGMFTVEYEDIAFPLFGSRSVVAILRAGMQPFSKANQVDFRGMFYGRTQVLEWRRWHFNSLIK